MTSEISLCGLHMTTWDNDTNESHKARVELATKLEAENPDVGWDMPVWYGYLAAVTDLYLDLSPDGIQPGFWTLLEATFSKEADQSDDRWYLYRDLIRRMINPDLVAASNGGKSQYFERHFSRSARQAWDDLEPDYNRQVAEMLREAADHIEAGLPEMPTD